MLKIKQKRRPGKPARSEITFRNMKGRNRLKKQLTEYINYCQGYRKMAKATMEYKEWCFNELARNTSVKSLEELTDKDVERWIRYNTEKLGNSPVTVNHLIAQLKVMIKWAKDMGIDTPVHVSYLQLQPVPDRDTKMSYTRKDIIHALAFADLREWLQIALMFDCGLRISELRHLRLENVENRGMNIIGKGSKLRYVMMSERTYERLQYYIEREQITDWLFPGRGGDKPISQQQIRRNTAKVFHRAGFKDYHPHMLRHSFAMDLLKEQQVGVRDIQQFLGHAKLDTTEVYLDKLSKDEKAKFWKEKRFGKDYALD